MCNSIFILNIDNTIYINANIDSSTTLAAITRYHVRRLLFFHCCTRGVFLVVELEPGSSLSVKSSSHKIRVSGSVCASASLPVSEVSERWSAAPSKFPT